MADNMNAQVVNIPALSGDVINAFSLSGGVVSESYLSGEASSQLGLSGNANVIHAMSAKVGINILSYDDPVDYLLLESGIILRTEDDVYLKLETSP